MRGKGEDRFQILGGGWLAYVLFVLLFASLSLGDEYWLVDEVVELVIGRSL